MKIVSPPIRNSITHLQVKFLRVKASCLNSWRCLNSKNKLAKSTFHFRQVEGYWDQQEKWGKLTMSIAETEIYNQQTCQCGSCVLWLQGQWFAKRRTILGTRLRRTLPEDLCTAWNIWYISPQIQVSQLDWCCGSIDNCYNSAIPFGRASGHQCGKSWSLFPRWWCQRRWRPGCWRWSSVYALRYHVAS